jgi:hypothetical protein
MDKTIESYPEDSSYNWGEAVKAYKNLGAIRVTIQKLKF